MPNEQYFPSQAGEHALAIAIIARALTDLFIPIEGAGLSAQRRRRYQRGAVAFFTPGTDEFEILELCCEFLVWDAREIGMWVKENYGREDFKRRIQQEASLAMLFSGEDARPGANKLLGAGTDNPLGDPANAEETDETCGTWNFA